MPNAPVKDEVRASSRWSTWLWTAFWILWAVRGVSFLVDLGAVEPIVAVASWVSFGAVLIELSSAGYAIGLAVDCAGRPHLRSSARLRS